MSLLHRVHYICSQDEHGTWRPAKNMTQLVNHACVALAMSKNTGVHSFPPPVGFDELKAAQIAAVFALLKGSEIEKLALIKLIYLAEREFISQHGHPMLMDEFYSLPHGPICSSALNGINGNLNKAIWAQYIGLDGKTVRSLGQLDRSRFDHVSDAEWEVLMQIWQSFGFMTASQLRNYTHKNCPEYTEVERGRIEISYRKLFEVLGFDDPTAYEDSIFGLRLAENALTR